MFLSICMNGPVLTLGTQATLELCNLSYMGCGQGLNSGCTHRAACMEWGICSGHIDWSGELGALSVMISYWPCFRHNFSFTLMPKLACLCVCVIMASHACSQFHLAIICSGNPVWVERSTTA